MIVYIYIFIALVPATQPTLHVSYKKRLLLFISLQKTLRRRICQTGWFATPLSIAAAMHVGSTVLPAFHSISGVQSKK